MLFKITNDVVKLKAKEGFDPRYVLEEAFNFVYDLNVKAVQVLIKGKVLTLDKNQDFAYTYNNFRKMQTNMVEEASKDYFDFDEKINYPYEIVSPLCLEVFDDLSLMFSIEDAIKFVEKYEVKNAKFKYKNNVIKIDKNSDIYETYNNLKNKKCNYKK